MVVMSAGSRADWVTVELVGSMAKNWIDDMVGYMTGCWVDGVAVARAVSKSGCMSVMKAG